MHPFLLTPEDIESYLDSGHWSKETMVDRYTLYASEIPDGAACHDRTESYNWTQLHTVTDRLASNLIDLGLARDATALVQIPSSCREFILRIGLKKAGIIGAFAPMQWRHQELEYTSAHVKPALVVMDRGLMGLKEAESLDAIYGTLPNRPLRIDLADHSSNGWNRWDDLLKPMQNGNALEKLSGRRFEFDEVSLITVSSGTSGAAKLCEWPEGAQMCKSRALGERMGLTPDDHVGIFAPMSGAAGLVVWMISASTPFLCTFPNSFKAANLLNLIHKYKITVVTTVPVILNRMVKENLQSYDLSSLRQLRVGTAAVDLAAARLFEEKTGCRVVVAAGAMECPGFGHASVEEPKEIRLDGSIGLPLRGCQLRIEDEQGHLLPAGTIGELKVSAPFASSGYWNNPVETKTVWSNGWCSTGDIGLLNEDGRLTLKGRLKETINRSGYKILPAELEKEISKHSDIFECAVVGAPDKEYGEAPWAFVQLRSGSTLDTAALTRFLKENGLANYKVPTRFIEIIEFPRVAGSKINKKELLKLAQS